MRTLSLEVCGDGAGDWEWIECAIGNKSGKVNDPRTLKFL
jgi:hypothetical protein